MAAMAVLSIRSGQTASIRFGLRMVDFILPRIRAGEATGGRFIKDDSRFIKAGQPQYSLKARPVAAMAVLSPRSGHMARSLDFGCG